MSTRLLLADDHQMVRQGLCSLLKREPGYEVVGEASDGREAVRLALEHRPQVVLMDVGMPNLNGIEATRQIKEAEPAIRVLAVSVHSDRNVVGQMLMAGASGYVLKDAAFEELLEAVRAVAANQTYLSPRVADVVVEHYVRHQHNGNGSAYSVLTPREREVLQLLAEGLGTKQIAKQLNISVKTIDTHRYQVMKKLQLRGLADLTRYALREGITTLDR